LVQVKIKRIRGNAIADRGNNMMYGKKKKAKPITKAKKKKPMKRKSGY
jgi:hypothetical protein|tara:strand:+ start:1055 stop:1198 length:144 start_codon:yes stop_codon:yes gene_type:complete